jgi:L-Ala-D/L-Glu epimerase / N-acetyl-D-glutamate racemase
LGFALLIRSAITLVAPGLDHDPGAASARISNATSTGEMIMAMTRKGFIKTLAGAAFAGGFLRGSETLLEAQEKAKIPLKAVRIRDIEVWPYNLAQKQVIHIALGSTSVTENVLVRLRTEEGVIGWGEASPFQMVTGDTQKTSVTLGREMADVLKGQDPFDLAKIVADMEAFAPHNPSIKAAFEMAVWDLCGKIAGRPVCCLLGNYRKSFETDQTIFIDTPPKMVEAAQNVVKGGFKTIKIKVGESPEKDIARLKAIRESVGDNIELRIDANQGWSPAEAVRALRGLEKYQIQECEQPVVYWDWDGLKFVHDNSAIPIMADESVHVPQDAIEAVRRDAVDMINIKLMKSGGILQGKRIAEIAAAANIKCMLGCMTETRLGLTAAAHLVASQKNIEFADLDAFLVHSFDPVIGGMEIKNGMVTLPETPGLGTDMDPSFVKKVQTA